MHNYRVYFHESPYTGHGVPLWMVVCAETPQAAVRTAEALFPNHKIDPDASPC